MADFASTGQPRSIAAPLDGPSNPAVYVLPQGVAFDLQSVFADIDATGAGPTLATLTIRDSSGAVIAKKRQDEPVSAGTAGSATWALRLGGGGAGSGAGHVIQDEGAPLPAEPALNFVGAGVTATDDPGGSRTNVTIPGGGLGAGFMEVIAAGGNTNIAAATTVPLPWVHSSGPNLLDLSTPTLPIVITPGCYAFNLNVVPAFAAVAAYEILWQVQQAFGGVSTVIGGRSPWSQVGALNVGAWLSWTREYAAGDGIRLNVRHTSATTRAMLLTGFVEQLS